MSSINYDSIWKLISQNKFVYGTDENVTCAICKGLLIDACQSHCGCQFCHSCIHDFIGNEHTLCPGNKKYCKEEHLVLDKNVLRSPMLNRKIATLKVPCPNHSCGSDIQLIEMEDHLRVCIKEAIECPFAVIGCTYEALGRDAAVTHVQKESLVHSELLIELIQNMKNEMNGLKDEIKNSKSENLSIKKELLEMRQEFNLKLDDATEDLKRNIDGQKGEIDRLTRALNDMRRESVVEISSLKREIFCLKNEINANINDVTAKLKINMDDLNVEMEKVTATVNNVGRVMRDKCENIESEIKSLKEELQNKDAKIACFEEELRQVIQEEGINEKRMEDTVATIVDELKNDIGKIRDLWGAYSDRKMLRWTKVCANVNADFIWRMEGCSRNKNKLIFSESFYTNNYKFCLRLRISRNGGANEATLGLSDSSGDSDDDTDDTIGVYCHIMSGDYDGKVRWPMNGGVTLSIIDQYTLKSYKTQTYKYNTYGFKKEFDRPIDDRNTFGIGSSLIKYSSIRDRPSIVVDDSIIVSCVITDL